MSDVAKTTRAETVTEETINAYRVQKLESGSVRIKSGGRVVTAPTYYDALERFAAGRKRDIEDSPEHLREEKRASIHGGYIPLYSLDSSGFTPAEILDAVTMHPLDIVLEDIGEQGDENGGEDE